MKRHIRQTRIHRRTLLRPFWRFYYGLTPGRKRAFEIAVLGGLPLLMLVLTIRFTFDWDTYHAFVAPIYTIAEPFEKEGWESFSAKRRFAMAKHMIVHDELIGLTTEDLHERLGSSPLRQVNRWLLGKRNSVFGQKSSYLCTDLGDDGRCKRAEIRDAEE